MVFVKCIFNVGFIKTVGDDFFAKGSYYEQTVKKTDFHQWLVNILKILIIVLHLNSALKK